MNTLELERIEEPDMASHVPTTSPPQNPLFERSVLLGVSFSKLGTSKRVRDCGIDKDADRDLVRISKRLFDCTELDAISKFDARVKAFLGEKCLPSPMRGGMFFLPLVSVEKVHEKLTHFAVERTVLVEAFAAVYPNLLLGAEMRLRELFEPSDYPPQSRVAAHFGLSWNFVSMDVPGALKSISQGLFEEERDKMAAQWSVAQEEIQSLLRVRLKSMIEHLGERLTPDAQGKSKVFRNSLVDNISDFLTEFSAINITNDSELEAVVNQARTLLDGVDAETLRRSTDARETVRVGFDGLAQNLEAMLVDRPMRSISFDDV